MRPGRRDPGAFARDLLNLTLSSPVVNRHRKAAKDVADWVPEQNACWFAARTLEVRRRYGLTIDAREAAAVERVLAGCASTEMAVSCRTTGAESAPARHRAGAAEPSRVPLHARRGRRRGRLRVRRAAAKASKRPSARRSPAAWLRRRLLARYLALLIPALVAIGVCFGALLVNWGPTVYLNAAAGLVMVGGYLWFRFNSRWSAANLEIGLDAEYRIGQVIV